MAREARAAETTEVRTLHSRNREIRRVTLDQIVENPLNFRTHDDLQHQSLQAAVGEIGWFGYPDVFEHPEHPGKLMLIDGALRREHLVARYGEHAAVDVNVCDFTPQEAAKALATKDPIAAMAGTDRDKAADLLRALEAESEGFGSLIEELARRERVDLRPLPEEIWQEPELPEPSPELAERWGVRPGALWELRGRATHRVLLGDPWVAESWYYLTKSGGAMPYIMLSQPPPETSGRQYQLFTGAVIYVWYTRETCVEVVGHLHREHYDIRAQLVWRRASEAAPGGEYPSQHRFGFYAVKRHQPARWNGSRKESTVADAAVPLYGAMPLEITGRALVNHGGPETTVYDPHACQMLGSSVIAAERLGRASFAMCQDRERAAAVLQRLADEGCEVVQGPAEVHAREKGSDQ